MGRCTALGATVFNLEGAIIHLEEQRTLHSLPSYESTLKLLQGEYEKALKAYLACLNPR